jgi:hypothetical protein
MADSTSNVEQVTFAQNLAAASINSLTDAASQAMFGGRDRVPTTGLTFGLMRGAFTDDAVISTLADTTVTLTDNTTNYVEVDDAGAISVNASAFTPGRAPLYTVVTASGVVTSYTDHRALWLPHWINHIPTISFASDANKTLTAPEARARFMNVTSGVSLGATRDLIVPLNLAPVAVYNGTTGGQSIRVIGTSGTGITIATAKAAIVCGNRTNIIRITADA